MAQYGYHENEANRIVDEVFDTLNKEARYRVLIKALEDNNVIHTDYVAFVKIPSKRVTVYCDGSVIREDINGVREARQPDGLETILTEIISINKQKL